MALRQDASTGEIREDGRPIEQQISDDGKTMHVLVYSPFKTYFNQEAHSISGENMTGPFDILPRHHNFISLLKPCELVVRTDAGEPRIRISGGIMHVRANQVTVFLDV